MVYPIHTPIRRTRRRLQNLAILLAILLSLIPEALPGQSMPAVYAHNLDQRMNWIQYDQETLDLIDQRIAQYQAGNSSALPLVQVGDELGMIIKVTPTDGTTTGAGGYVTAYLPNGVQLTGVAYLQPDGNGGYTQVPMKGQAIEPLGYGPIGPADTPELIGLVLDNIMGQSSLAVSAPDGTHLGTMAGVYGDTGIFYATEPDLAWQSWINSSPALGTSITNNRGETFVPYNKWDAEQMYAWGIKSPVSPIVDPNGRGSAPWGTASGVAGLESGYKYAFDKDVWDASAKDAAAMRSSIVPGPWRRIQYAGSQIAVDEPGRTENTLGFVGQDASQIGWALSSVTPLTATTSQSDNSSPKVIRWSVGALIENRPEYVWFKVKVLDTTLYQDNCTTIYHTDVIGGEDGGKDHLWRYYDPTTADLNNCVALKKQASAPVVALNEIFTYDIEVVNTSQNITLQSVLIQDTLPGGVTFLSASPTADSGPNPLTWTIPNLAPGEKFSAIVTVRAKSTGLFLNQLCASAANLSTACVDEGTYLGATPYLLQSKSASSASIEAGGTIQYTILIDNIGTGASDSPLEIIDYLPGNFTFVSLDSVRVNDANAQSFTTVNATNPSRPIFEVNRAINADKSLELTFTAQVPANVTPGSRYCNTFTAKAEALASTGTEACVSVGGATIGDTIWADWDGNGVQDASEEGIAGITLQLNTGQTATTDSNGEYLFTALTPGNYTVSVTDSGGKVAGYTPTYDYDGTGTANQAAVTVATDEEQLAVDFGYRPTGSGSIGDLVFEDTGNDGAYNSGLGDVGINGVTVNLYEDQNGNGIVDAATDTLITNAVTAGGGAYLFSNLATGFNYIVDAVDGDVTTQLGTAAWLAVTPDPHKVTNLSGPYLTADFGYFKIVPGSIGDQVFIDTNTNNTYEMGVDTPLANVTLVLYQDGGTVGSLGAGDTAIMTTTSSITGTYKFANLPAGNYIVDVIQSDPDVPANHAPSGTEPFPVVLGLSQVYTDADFPFRYVAPPPSPLAKSVNKTNANPGETLYYTLTTNYTGSSLLTNVTVTDAVPAGTTYVAASVNAGGSESGGVVTWNLASNASGVPGVSNGGGIATVFTALKDATVTSARPNNNFGGSTLLGVNSVYNSLVQFDLSSIPAGISIANAQLVMERVGGTLSPTGSVEVRALTQSWDEGVQNDAACTDGVTWANRDCNPVAAWTTAGGTYNATVFASNPVGTGTNTWDVTQLVEAWVQNKLTNNGFLLRVPSGSDTHNFSSKEGATPPKLLITYGPADGMGVWTSASATPSYSLWEPYAFGSTISTGVSTGSAYRIMQAAAAPTRLEKMAVGIINNASNNVVAMRWSGSAWVSASINPLGTVAETFWWTADVAYEQTSGDALMVWGNGTSLQYSEWNGSSWTVKTTISPTPLAGTIKTVRLASKPGSNEIVAAVATTAGHYALIWSGSAWGNGQPLYNTAKTDYTDIDVAYEQSSGRALVVYGKNSDANVYYQIWTGSTWIGEASLAPPSGVTAAAKWYVLASDPASNRLALGVQTTSPDGWLSVWSGSVWETAARATASGLLLDASTAPNLGVAFEGVSGKALAVYGRSAQNVVFYRTWTDGSGWGSEIVGPTIGANTNSLTLDGHAQSSRILLSVQDDANDLHYLLWNGTSWGADTVKSTNTGETKNQPFAFMWDNVVSVSSSVSQSSDDAEEIGAPGTYRGGPGNVYIASSDLELVEDLEPTSSGRQTVGVRFQNISVPQGAIIARAYLTFYAVDADSPNTNNNTANLVIQGQAADNASTFVDDGASGSSFSISDTNQRPRTSAAAAWAPTTSWSAGTTYATADLSTVVQEIVDRDGWASGNSMAFIITGTGSRSASSWDYAGTPPGLVIEYTMDASIGFGNAITVSPTLINAGDQITVSMTLTATQDTASVESNTLIVTGANGVNATLDSGPTPTSGTVGMGGTTFTWVYNTSGTGNIGQITFGGGADDGDDNTWPWAVSNSVIVAPPLTFRTTVNTPATVNPVSNTGYIKSASVIPLTPSNTVQTHIGASIGDFVWADLDGDGVQDVGEPGLNGVQVCATPTAGGATVCTTSDALGSYHIYGLTDGVSYNVTLTPATVPTNYLPTTATTLTRTATIAGVTDADFGLRPPGTATIGDTVWIDSNEDGVLDSGEAGLPGVTVKLYNSAGALLLDTVQTDANGIYTFTGLYAGNYQVQVDTTSAVTTSHGVVSTIVASMDLVSVAGSTASLTNPLAVNVATDVSAVTTADFGYNWGGSIGDYVWWDDNVNQIQDEAAGRGIPNVVVLLYYDANGNGKYDGSFIDTQVGFGLTNASGYYTINNLPPGMYLVDVYEDSITTDGNRDVAPTTPNIVLVNLSPNQDVDTADFGYYEGAIIGDTVWQDADGNGIQNGTEPGLATVRVYLYDSAGTNLLDTQTTDSEGIYQFLVAPGEYVVRVERADVAASLNNLTTLSSFPASVAAGDWELEMDFGFTYNGVIGNLVFNDVDNNGVYEAADGESGLSNVTVYLYSGGLLVDAQATDSQGGYRFEGLPGGTYTVTVDSSTLPADYIVGNTGTAGVDNNSQSQPYQIVLAEGGSNLTADFGYRYDSLTTGQSVHTIAGNIWHDADGDGIYAPGGESLIATVDVTVNCGSDGIFLATSSAFGFGGNWSVAGVPDGATCTISVDESDLPSASYVQTGDPDTTPLPCSGAACDGQTTVTVGGSDIFNQNFGYQEQLSSIAGAVCAGNFGLIGLCDDPANELPLAGVTVTLIFAGPDGFLNSGDEVTQTTQTDASGLYTFTNLAAGPYQIRETNLPDFISLGDADGFDKDVIDINNLAAGQNLTDQDFVDDPTLVQIGGGVYEDLNGNGLFDSGEPPLQGVTITLNSGVTTVTDVKGLYTFTVSSHALYTVTAATLPGYLSSGSEAGSNGAVSVDGDTIQITTGIRDSLGNNFLDYRPSTLGDQVWNDIVENGSPDPGEPGVDNATLTLREAGPDGLVGTIDDVTYPDQITSSGGGYDFTNLPPGVYKVTLDPLSLPLGFETTLPSDSLVITLTSGTDYNLADFPLRYSGKAVIGDYVWTDANGDGDFSGDVGEAEYTAGLNGVTVTLWLDQGAVGFDPVEDLLLSWTATGDNPATVGVESGWYGFNVAADATLANPPDFWVVVDDANFASGGVLQDTLYTSGGVFPDHQLYYPNLAAPGTSSADFGYALPATITGTVWNDLNGNAGADGGEPGLSGVLITLSNGLTTTTDINGVYTFTVAPGAYTISETNPSGYTSTGDTDGANDDQIAVTVISGESSSGHDFLDAQPGILGGAVYEDLNGDGNQDSGEPGIPGVEISLSTGVTATTDANGVYTFTNLLPGTYTITETNPAGYTSTGAEPGTAGSSVVSVDEIQVTLTSGQSSLQNDFLDARPVTVTGVVYDDQDGAPGFDAGDPPLTGVLISLSNGMTATTDANGVYTFTNLMPGDYTIDEETPSGYSSTGDVDGANDDRITITITSGVNISGRNFWDQTVGYIGDYVWYDADRDGLQDGTEVGIPGVVITLTLPDTSAVTTTTDANGAYSFTGIAGGTYTVTVDLESLPTTDFTATSGPGSKSSPHSITLNAGQGYASADFGFVVLTALALDKELLTPSPARYQEEITFTIRITNTGRSWITVLPVTDTFNDQLMRYERATPAPDVGLYDGILTWSDLTTAPGVGDLAPQASALITVTFTALRDTTSLPGGVATNTVTTTNVLADPDGPNTGLGDLDSPLDAQDAASVVILNPTAVQITGGQVQWSQDHVALTWDTVSEVQLAGFYIWRQNGDGMWVLLTAELIPAQRAGQAEGGHYAFQDEEATSDNSSAYRLEIVEQDGSTQIIDLGTVSGMHRTFLPLFYH